MSLTDQALEDRRWKMMPEIRKALRAEKLGWEYYGPSSVSESRFERLTSLWENALLVLHHKDRLGALDPTAVHNDLSRLEDELLSYAEQFAALADDIRNLHDHIARR